MQGLGENNRTCKIQIREKMGTECLRYGFTQPSKSHSDATEGYEI